jgi:hypothetical protein
MKSSFFPFCLLLPALACGQSAVTLHYWDMDTLDAETSTVPIDLAGGAVTTGGGNLVLDNAAYSSSPAGGNYLLTDRNLTGIPMTADVFDNGVATGMDFGTDSFSFSYWVYNDATDDADDARRVRVFDSLNGIDVGIQLGSNLQGTFNFRIDDDQFGEVLSNQQAAPLDTLSQPDDEWVLVAVTVKRSGGESEAEIFFGGVSQGTYDVSLLMGNITAGQDLQIGCINGGANASGIQTGGIDDLAFYSGVLSSIQISQLVGGAKPTDVAPTADQKLGHYWDFDTVNGFIPVDVFGGLATTERGIVSVGEDANWGEAYPDSGLGLLTQGGFSDHLVADSFNETGASALDFGEEDFAVSFWSFSPASEDYGAAVFDFMADGGSGMELGTDENGVFQLQLSDDLGNLISTTGFVVIENVVQPGDQWVQVSINIDRGNDELSIFFDGVEVPGSPFVIDTLTGAIACSQDLEIGVRNSGTGAGNSQSAGLDDFAIYPGLLTGEQISGLADQSTDPLEILESLVQVPTPELEIVSFERNSDSGEVSLIFGSAAGQAYRVFGGVDLENPQSWPELTTEVLSGTGSNLEFTHTPSDGAGKLFLQVRRED